MEVEFMDEPVECRIKRGVVYLSWPSGYRKAIPIDIFRRNLAAGQKALAEFDAKHGVVGLRRGHG